MTLTPRDPQSGCRKHNSSHQSVCCGQQDVLKRRLTCACLRNVSQTFRGVHRRALLFEGRDDVLTSTDV